ncbi:MAG: macrolide transporter subunit MacA [Rhizobacter sp.]
MARSSFNLRIGIVLVLLLAVAGAVLAAWWSPGKAPQYTTTPIVKTDLEQVVLASGVLEATRQVDVGAQVNGQLKALRVRVGDKVKKGDLLAEIDPILAENALNQAIAGRDSLRGQFRAREAKFRQAQALWTRQTEMLAHDATSRQDVESADAEMKSLQGELVALQAQIRQQGLGVESARQNMAYTRIAAPISGEVVSIDTLEGQTVVASYQVPTILKLADLSTMTVKVHVSEGDVMRMKVGQPVYFSVLGEPDQRFHSKLRAILPSPEKLNNAVFFSALFDVPNPEGRLRTGMTAQVSIVLGQAAGALSIPLAALGERRPDGRHDVRVLVPSGRVEVRSVRIGLRSAIHAQVLEGLKQDEQVITGDGSHISDDPNVSARNAP